jgi:trans-2,3-dihydro-3-hydroxyanthranilate isomerase
VTNGRRFLQYDVFTDRPLTGNQLAVFMDARGLAAETMAAMTRETNFSEATFVTAAEQPGTDIRLRIFGRGGEMPFAGHPVIGSTFALADDGVITAGTKTFTFGLNIGPAGRRPSPRCAGAGSELRLGVLPAGAEDARRC